MDLFSHWETSSWRMFEANLIISSMVLFLAWLIYFFRRRDLVGDPENRSRHGLRYVAIILLPVVILFMFQLLGRLQLVQLLALLLLSAACGSRNWPSRRFATVGLVVTLFLATVVGVQGVLQAARAGKQHPMESLAQRLESRVQTPKTPAPLSSAAVASLETIEKHLSNKMERQIFGRYQKRRAALEMIHASQVMQFISSEGFGIGRIHASKVPHRGGSPLALFTGDYLASNHVAVLVEELDILLTEYRHPSSSSARNKERVARSE
mgnify:CR=1 FL=1